MEKMRLSKSKITSYDMCPKQYYYRYVKRVKPKDMAQLILGKKLHSKYESFYRALPDKIESEKQVKEIFEDTCGPDESLREKSHLLSFLDMNLTSFKDLETKKLLKYFKPIAIEEKYYDEEMDFVGVIDAVFQLEDKILIVDWKSSYYKPGRESYSRFELAGYKHLWDKFNPDLPATHWGIGFSGNNVFWIEEVNQRSTDAMYQKIERVRQLIKEKKFDKKQHAPCQWCSFYERCWEGENGV